MMSQSWYGGGGACVRRTLRRSCSEGEGLGGLRLGVAPALAEVAVILEDAEVESWPEVILVGIEERRDAKVVEERLTTILVIDDCRLAAAAGLGSGA